MDAQHPFNAIYYALKEAIDLVSEPSTSGLNALPYAFDNRLANIFK